MSLDDEWIKNKDDDDDDSRTVDDFLLFFFLLLGFGVEQWMKMWMKMKKDEKIRCW